MENGVLPEDMTAKSRVVVDAGQMSIIRGCLYRCWFPQRNDQRADTRLQLVLPSVLREKVMSLYHEGSFGGHFGLAKSN